LLALATRVDAAVHTTTTTTCMFSLAYNLQSDLTIILRASGGVVERATQFALLIFNNPSSPKGILTSS